MNLKQYARSHKIGGITWWLMPYRTLRLEAIGTQFDKIIPNETRGFIENSFVAVESYSAAIDFDNDLSAEERRFADYWADRSSALVDRWMSFSMVVPESVLLGFWAAYNATRDEMIEKVESADASDVPNSSPVSESS